MLHKLIEKLNSINNNHGKGTLTFVLVDLAICNLAEGIITGKVIRKLQYGSSRCKFKIEGNKLTFIGHTVTLK